MTHIKICGITRLPDAVAAIEAGADAIGFVFVASSPRCVTVACARSIGEALPAGVLKVGVFVDTPRKIIVRTADHARLDVVQLHGDESPEDCTALGRTVWKRFKVVDGETEETLRARALPYRVDACLLDPGQGSGRTFRWEIARGIEAPLIVAGGLTPGNVATAMRRTRAWGVDVSSGVETGPGRKDPAKLRALIEAARREDERYDT